MTTTPLDVPADSCALLVIDMQNDFLDPNGYFARRGRPTERLRRAIAPTRRLRTALPPAVRMVLTAQIYEADGSDDLARVHRLKPAALVREGPPPVVRGTWGAEIVPELAGRGDLVLAKRRFDAFHQTDLELLLRCWGIKTLILAGVVADVCVETTLRAAYVRDFDVILARDCVAGWRDADEERTAAAVASHFGLCLSNDEIMEAIQNPSDPTAQTPR